MKKPKVKRINPKTLTKWIIRVDCIGGLRAALYSRHRILFSRVYVCVPYSMPRSSQIDWYFGIYVTAYYCANRLSNVRKKNLRDRSLISFGCRCMVNYLRGIATVIKKWCSFPWKAFTADGTQTQNCLYAVISRSRKPDHLQFELISMVASNHL